MSRIIVITGMFDIEDSYGHPTGRKELLASHGINENDGSSVCLQPESPQSLGATYDNDLREWVIQ